MVEDLSRSLSVDLLITRMLQMDCEVPLLHVRVNGALMKVRVDASVARYYKQ